MNKKIIIIIGMSRSGTTVVSKFLESVPDTCVIFEPHIAWKINDFMNLFDSDRNLNKYSARWIKGIFYKFANNKNLIIEKSPINCLRPKLIYSAFPEAKIIYLNRDPIRCIYSNYQHSVKRSMFRFKAIRRKYLNLGDNKKFAPTNRLIFFKQLNIYNLPGFFVYSMRLLYYKIFKNTLPFGPKLDDFRIIIKKHGLIFYHCKVFVDSIRAKQIFQKLFSGRIQEFHMEEIFSDPNEIVRLFKFCNYNIDIDIAEKLLKKLNQQNIKKINRKSDIDEEIINNLTRLDYYYSKK